MSVITVHPFDLKIVKKTMHERVVSFCFSIRVKELDPELGNSGYMNIYYENYCDSNLSDYYYRQMKELLDNPFKINPSIDIEYIQDDTKYVATNIFFTNNKKVHENTFLSYLTEIMNE